MVRDVESPALAAVAQAHGQMLSSLGHLPIPKRPPLPLLLWEGCSDTQTRIARCCGTVHVLFFFLSVSDMLAVL